MRGVYEKVKGSGDWYISYFDGDGRHHREHVGRQSAAIEAYVTKKREIREGKFVPPADRKKTSLTVQEVFDQRMAEMEGQLSFWTARNLKYRFATPRFDALRKMAVRRVTGQNIKELLSSLYREGFEKSSIHSYRGMLGAIFAFALERGYIVVNPVKKTSPPKQVRGRIRFLSAEEEAAIRKVIVERWPEREAEFDALLHTGMRIGELWHLTWDRVHPERNIIEVPEEGKTGWRDVPLNSASRRAFEILHRQSHGSEYVVPNAYTVRGRRYPASWVGEAADKAGVLNVSPHTLRHTFASRLVMAGVNLRRVQQYMGHASIEMTMKYAHLSPENTVGADIERLVAVPAAPAAVAASARPKRPARVKVASGFAASSEGAKQETAIRRSA